MWMRQSLSSLIAFLLLTFSPLNARVVRVEVTSRNDVLGGKTFGNSGSYERIAGRVYFSVAVANPHNAHIVDLTNAVNLKNGEVEFSSDFTAIRPKDARKSNGSLLLEIPNRGNRIILALVDGGDPDVASDAGDAWLLRNGYTILSLGWQWDAPLPDSQRLFAPVAKENGKAITGLLRGDLMPWKKMQDIPLGHLFPVRMAGGRVLSDLGGLEYSVDAPDDPRNVLTVRESRETQRTVIPRTKWQFARMVDGKLTPSDRYFATSCMKVSMRMKRAESRWTAFWLTLREPVGAVSTIVLRSPHEMRSPHRQFSFRLISFPSLTSRSKTH